MNAKIGINGFGRIGRILLRIISNRTDMEVVAINNPGLTLDYAKYEFTHDTIHGRFNGSCEVKGDFLVVNGKKIAVFGGRYGLGSKEFKPRDVKAIVEYMMQGRLHHNFTVGIDDDLTNLSLDTDKSFTIENKDVKTAVLYGIGSDGTVGAVKNIVKIVGENSDLYPQSYAVYDSKKSGGITQSHIRFSEKPIKSEYLVESADFICVSNFMIAQRFDVFASLRAGGTVMINTSQSPDKERLPSILPTKLSVSSASKSGYVSLTK